MQSNDDEKFREHKFPPKVEKHKIKIDITESDLQDLANGETFDWTYTTDKGVKVDVHLFNPDAGEWCPRCIEEYQDDEGKWQDGEYKPTACHDCGVCKDCEHFVDCPKSN